MVNSSHQLSAFPGPCPPVVRLPWTLPTGPPSLDQPTSVPPSLDPASLLSAFFVCFLFLPASYPPFLGPACQLSASPGTCPPVVRLPWTLPASCRPSLDLARQLSHSVSRFSRPFRPKRTGMTRLGLTKHEKSSKGSSRSNRSSRRNSSINSAGLYVGF